VWSVRSKRASLYLGGGTIAVAAEGMDGQWRELSDESGWRGVLEEWVDRYPNRAWHVVLGGHRCLLHSLGPIPGTRSIEEAEAVASASLSTEEAPVQARLAVWSPGGPQPWLAACTPVGLVEDLRSIVEAGGRLQALQPWWELVPSKGRLTSIAMCDDESVTYWRSDSQGVITAAGTMLVLRQAQANMLQRLQVGGALAVWRLDSRLWAAADHSSVVREEGGHVADGVAV
jgi:hypothetical protein